MSVSFRNVNVDPSDPVEAWPYEAIVAATWAFREGLELRAGRRALEGGADDDEVYNFSWFH